MRKTLLAGLAWMALSVFGSVAAAEVGAPAASSEPESGVMLAPGGEFYPQYIADPHRGGFEWQLASVSDGGIPETGRARVGLRLGGRLDIFGHDASVDRTHGWQIGLEAGFISDFDLDHSYDNIGWDGTFGVVATSALNSDVHFKFGVMHRSSHVGDEYAERTRRQRINYTREEWLAGLGWNVTPSWRLYGEYGWAHEIRNKALQARGRAQAGLEYVPARERGWFAAVDVSAMEERDWRADTSLRVGYLFRTNGQQWTLALTHYNGRPRIGEFIQHTETYSGISLMVDM